MIPYKSPEHGANAFNCPHCNAYSRMLWYDMWRSSQSGQQWIVGTLNLAECSHCGNYSLWHFEEMIYPEASGITLSNSDLRDDIKEDYDEARKIVNKSPRGAAALLRLGIQKLCIQLGENGNNINNDIANLVKKGLPLQIQQALDVVRVVGNNAVHPGQLDLKDDREIAIKLFGLINLIAEVMITQPKHIQQMYDSLPQSTKDAIQKRDSGGS